VVKRLALIKHTAAFCLQLLVNNMNLQETISEGEKEFDEKFLHKFKNGYTKSVLDTPRVSIDDVKDWHKSQQVKLLEAVNEKLSIASIHSNPGIILETLEELDKEINLAISKIK